MVGLLVLAGAPQARVPQSALQVVTDLATMEPMLLHLEQVLLKEQRPRLELQEATAPLELLLERLACAAAL